MGQVEVEEHRLAGVGEQDVGRLHVEVEDAPGVGVGQSVGELPYEPQHRVRVADQFAVGVGRLVEVRPPVTAGELLSIRPESATADGGGPDFPGAGRPW